jgi:hypothetical protein
VCASIPEGADWRAVLAALGYQLERRRQRGWLARHERAPVAVVHPKADAAEFARLDADGRPPEGLLLNDCRTDGAAFGILASGSRLRLVDAGPAFGSASGQYLDLDAGALRAGDRPFLGLLGPGYLATEEFARLHTEAARYPARLGSPG